MKHLCKIYKKILISVAVVAISAIMASGFGPEQNIKQLVAQRIEILDSYYCGHSTFEEANFEIEKIESGRLLKEDVKGMKDFFQTDIETVQSYEIEEIDVTCQDEYVICAVVKIIWMTSGIHGEEKTEGIYSVIIEKTENSYKLVQFF